MQLQHIIQDNISFKHESRAHLSGINLVISLLPYFGFIMGMFMWLVDAAVDAYIIEPDKAFWDSVYAAESTEMWMRSLVLIVMTVSALVVQFFMRKQYRYEMLLFRHQQNLERIVAERTRELQQLANLDALTQIYNRRIFEKTLESEIVRSQRYRQPLSLILLDLDHFKQVNDQYGHDEGDRVLRDTADILRNHLRQSDIYARWGGEEFIVGLPHSDANTAEKVAVKLCQLIGTLRCGNNNQEVTASFGVSQYRHDETIHHLIKRSDDALYEAKRSGRNRVCLSN